MTDKAITAARGINRLNLRRGDLDTTEETTKDASKSEEVEPRRDEKKMSEPAAAVLQLTPNYQSYSSLPEFFVDF